MKRVKGKIDIEELRGTTIRTHIG